MKTRLTAAALIAALLTVAVSCAPTPGQSASAPSAQTQTTASQTAADPSASSVPADSSQPAASSQPASTSDVPAKTSEPATAGTEPAATEEPSPEQLAYDQALKYLQEGDRQKAAEIFYDIIDYGDAREHFFEYGKVVFSKTRVVNSDGTTSETEYEYDDHGNVTVCSVTAPDGSAERWSFTYEYYPDGKLKKESRLGDDGTYVWEYEYDSHGNVTLERSIPPHGAGEVFTTTHEYVYHDNGKIAKRTDLDSSSQKTVTEYDPEGRETRITCYYDGDPTYQTVSTYNEYGDIISAVTTNADGSKDASHFTYEYDSAGRAKRVELDMNGNLTVKTYEYDDKSNVTRTVVSSNGEETVTENSYDDRGNLIMEVSTYPGDLVTTVTYSGYKPVAKY